MTTTTGRHSTRDLAAIKVRAYRTGVSFGWRWAADFQDGSRTTKRAILARLDRMGEVIYREAFAAGCFDGLNEADAKVGLGRLASVLCRM